VVGWGFRWRVRRRAEGRSVERERSVRTGEARTWAVRDVSFWVEGRRLDAYRRDSPTAASGRA
jgi:hypothetical protein